MQRGSLHERSRGAASLKRQKPSQENSRPAKQVATNFCVASIVYKSRGETVPKQGVPSIEARGFSNRKLI